MKTVNFEIQIKASKEKIWSVLWEDETFRQWANIVDEGTYMVGELKEGVEIQFFSSSSGYGVTSLVEKIDSPNFIQFRHKADTQDLGRNTRDQEWTGGRESYSLQEKGDSTLLTVSYDLPPTQEEYFQKVFPQALSKIKELAEA